MTSPHLICDITPYGTGIVAPYLSIVLARANWHKNDLHQWITTVNIDFSPLGSHGRACNKRVITAQVAEWPYEITTHPSCPLFAWRKQINLRGYAYILHFNKQTSSGSIVWAMTSILFLFRLRMHLCIQLLVLYFWLTLWTIWASNTSITMVLKYQQISPTTISVQYIAMWCLWNLILRNIYSLTLNVWEPS